MVMKRTENGRSERHHGVLKILVIFLAIIAIFGPTVLVISDAWAKGGSAGSGGSPGSSGNGGGGNGGGSGSSNGSGGSGGAGNSGTAGGNGNGGGQGNGNGGGGSNGGVGGAPGNAGGGNGGGGNGGNGGGGTGGGGNGGTGGGGTGGGGTGGTGGGGTGGGGTGGTGGGGNGGGGNGGGGNAGGGNSDGGSSGASGGAIATHGDYAKDARIASTERGKAHRFLPDGVRKGTAFLTPNQEYTLDVFNACKTETQVNGAFLTILKTNGGFGFDSEDSRGAKLLINCMTSYGFTFPSVAVGPVDNFAPVADVLERAPVSKAAKK
jgi:hypothetical protein